MLAGPVVSNHRFASLLRLAGEAIRVEAQFGTQSLEALAWVASTVGASVYVPESLVRTPTGFRFALANPPLRVGAFSSLSLRVDGVVVPSDRVRVRLGPACPWRETALLTPSEPLELAAGTPIEFDADWPLREGGGEITLRLEFHNVAIPPLVWLEVRGTPREMEFP